MNRGKELLEAKLISKNILELIDKAIDKLNSAKNWGIFDMIGGGFITSLIKRSKIDDVNSLLNEIEYQLDKLSKELNDINYSLPQGIDNGFMSQLFDIGFDNFFMDIMVQSELNETKNQLSYLWNEIKRIDEYLEKELEGYID
ncbi:MAG: hypothetical protein MR601_01470 [Erysipelotrichaceae bacterium]|nr:hypothetical protein [Erysipelotrichaceae bacterium]